MNKTHTIARIGVLLVPFALAIPANAQHHKRFVGQSKTTFASVWPLIKDKCVSCHNSRSHPEKVDMSSYAAVMKSGDHKPIVIAGDIHSKLIRYVDGEKKPRMPMGRKPLSYSEINSLKRWILAGAKN